MLGKEAVGTPLEVDAEDVVGGLYHVEAYGLERVAHALGMPTGLSLGACAGLWSTQSAAPGKHQAARVAALLLIEPRQQLVPSVLNGAAGHCAALLRVGTLAARGLGKCDGGAMDGHPREAVKQATDVALVRRATPQLAIVGAAVAHGGDARHIAVAAHVVARVDGGFGAYDGVRLGHTHSNFSSPTPSSKCSLTMPRSTFVK